MSLDTVFPGLYDLRQFQLKQTIQYYQVANYRCTIRQKLLTFSHPVYLVSIKFNDILSTDNKLPFHKPVQWHTNKMQNTDQTMPGMSLGTVLALSSLPLITSENHMLIKSKHIGSRLPGS